MLSDYCGTRAFSLSPESSVLSTPPYIGRHEPEILTHLELVVNTVSMEEAVQQQIDSEVTEPMSAPETGAVPGADPAQS